MRCKKHPTYRAILRPRTTCEACWLKWLHDRGYVTLRAWHEGLK